MTEFTKHTRKLSSTMKLTGMTAGVSLTDTRLSRQVVHKLDGATHVAFYYSPDEPRYLGFAPADPDDPDAYRLRDNSGGHPNTISTAGAIRALGYDPKDVAGRYKVVEHGNLLAIDFHQKL